MKPPQHPIQKLTKALASGSRKDAEKIFVTFPFDVNLPLEFGSSSPLRPVSWTALIYACKNLNVDLVKLLLEKGADPATDVNDGFSPIMAVTTAAEKDQESGIKCAKLLIDAGLQITKVPMSHKRTLLTQAVRKNLASLLDFYLEVGADPSERDGDGKTPLNLAVKQNSMDLVECLRKHGVNPFKQNLDGKNCLDIATNSDNEEMTAYIMSWRQSYYKENFSKNKDSFRKMWEEVNAGCAMYCSKSAKKPGKVKTKVATAKDNGVDLPDDPKRPSPSAPLGHDHANGDSQQSPVPAIGQALPSEEMSTPASPLLCDNDQGDALPLSQNFATAILRLGEESILIYGGDAPRPELEFIGEAVSDVVTPFPDEFVSVESSPRDDVSMSFPSSSSSSSSSPASSKDDSGKLDKLDKGASLRHDLMLIAGAAFAAIAMYHFLRKFKTTN